MLQETRPTSKHFVTPDFGLSLQAALMVGSPPLGLLLVFCFPFPRLLCSKVLPGLLFCFALRLLPHPYPHELARLLTQRVLQAPRRRRQHGFDALSDQEQKPSGSDWAEFDDNRHEGVVPEA
ncbi:hypothetical protein DEJ16_03575 [Curtobacterium sp. MCJR17_055]|nr:hypothetical protein DEI87_10985 [Curtobacterium sp. MCBD17_029]PYY58750.1 hypothetical protein DEJ16_03575 [Curtobacterium sp. MCJR17_055]PYY59709.1 hypothetical protein DEJ26_07330 [Curtobacterium sp. MCPF17_015]